ncbi:hypothetical protein GCM10020218_096950 [Dactylosporangium vinaceum]
MSPGCSACSSVQLLFELLYQAWVSSERRELDPSKLGLSYETAIRPNENPQSLDHAPILLTHDRARQPYTSQTSPLAAATLRLGPTITASDKARMLPPDDTAAMNIGCNACMTQG